MKPLWQSKTVWAGLIAAVAQLAPMVPALAPYVGALNALALALGAVGVRSAIAKP